METATKSPTPHLGRKISRIRELRGMKQEALAIELGISQQAISKIEQSELWKKKLWRRWQRLWDFSRRLSSISEEAIFNNINSFHDNSALNDYSAIMNYQCQFNPLDKVVELYERLLASEKEKVEMLERVLKERG